MKETELESLTPQDRHCLYGHQAKEAEGPEIFSEVFDKYFISKSLHLNRTVFRNYSQTGCMFECKLLGAQAWEHLDEKFEIDCLPWDYLPVNFGNEAGGQDMPILRVDRFIIAQYSYYPPDKKSAKEPVCEDSYRHILFTAASSVR